MLKKIKLWLQNFHGSSLGPILNVFNILGIWRRRRPVHKTVMFYTFLCYNIVYVANISLNLIVNFEYNMFITFVNYSAYYLSTIKIGSFTRWCDQWETVVDTITELEQESTEDVHSDHSAVVFKYRKYCHWIVYGFWIACWPIVVFMFICYWFKDVLILNTQGPIIPIPYIFQAWLPFDQNSLKGRCASAVLQTMFGTSAPLHTCSWDSLVMSSMVFFAGQQKALRVRCARALDEKNDVICWHNLIKCHDHHVKLLKCQRLFISLISPIMFVHLLQVSLNCGICIVKIIMYSDDTAEVVSTIDLLIGVNLQLLLFYWVANEVIVQSMNLSYGIFESDWVRSSLRVRRAVFMLGVGMSKIVVFTAGPYHEMSLATFIAVLRSSYSFYTLMSRSM